MMKKLSISFKQGEEEIYEYVKNQLSTSIYIKKLILEDMKKKEEEQDERPRNHRNRASVNWGDI